MFYGKLIGGVIGLLTGGIFGLVLGVVIGHLFDRGLTHTLRFGSPEQIERIKQCFFETTFLLCGYLAKADGRISRQEIDHTESFFTQMGLTSEQRRRAIELFRRGAAPDFHPEPVLATFLQTCGHQRQLRQMLLVFLVSLALADNRLEQAELDALTRIATPLGVARGQLEQLLRMARAQEHFHGRDGFSPQPGTGLDDAYAALGVTPEVSDRDLKRAYRRLMSEHHPDKLIARGVPEDMVRLATERSQEVQAAYEMVKKSRGIGK